ncbi:MULTISPECIES: branched-chain amino acid ABC transporter permease [unclassified Nocardioides]|uniref:branched-chain amino acid ABC transporter permease n=1 Tax=unclassified Nocardioides TaxID=2615069 RepID=UPI00360F8E80
MALTLVKGSRRYVVVLVAITAAAATVLIALPYMIGTIAGIGTLSQLVAYAVAILGLSLVIGYTGQISLGHSAFVGLGGYLSMILVVKQGWPYLATIPVSFALCALAGALIGIPALRIRGLYLAAVTLSIAALFPVLVGKFPDLTGGTTGLFAPEMEVPNWLPVNPYTENGPVTIRYYVILGVAVLMFLIGWSIVSGRVGRAMRAVRDAPLGASAAGVQVARVKIFAFAMSAAFGGVAGSLLVIQTPSVSDTRFDLFLAIFLLVAMIAGGSTSVLGAIPGAIIFITLRVYIADWADGQSWLNGPKATQVPGIVSGVLLLIFIFLLPGGVADGIKRVLRKVVVVVPKQPAGWEQYQLVDRSSGSGTPRTSPQRSVTSASPR